MTREIVHIGFPKSATTTLQEHLFARHPEILNLARPFTDKRCSALCTALALSDDIDYPEEELLALIDSHRKKRSQVLLYSDETVVNSAIRSIAAKRLKRLFPNGRIIAVLRRQSDAFASHYANSGRRLRSVPEPYAGRHINFDDYLAFHFAHIGRGFLSTLMYREILETYELLFGRDRVHVLLFEEFLQDRPAFIAKLSDILDMDPVEIENLLAGRHKHKRTIEATGRYQALRSRFLWNVPLSRIVPGSRYIKHALFRLWGIKPLEVAYPAGWKERIDDLYRSGNRVLRDRHDLPLERYGYPL